MNTAHDLNPEYFTDEDGNKAVKLSLESFEELMQDYADLAEIARRKDEPVTTHADFMQELKDEGLV